MKEQILLAIATVLLTTLCLGIPTKGHTSGVDTPPGEAHWNETESSNSEQIQQDDNTLVDPESGKAEETHQDEYNTGLYQATGKFDQNVDNQEKIPQDTGNDFTATNKETIPDYESLVALVWKQAEDYNVLKEDYRVLQAEMKYLLHNQQSISSADKDSGANLTIPTNMSDKEFGSEWAESNQDSSSSIYVRWGRNDCPPTATAVYTGFAAGSYRHHTGGGSNYLCLPDVPIYLGPTGGENGERAELFGVDYEVFNFPPLSHLDEHDAPCAVCETLGRSNTLMVPARTDCPNGWMKEYHGYLMTSEITQQRTEFVCIDCNAEIRPGTIGEGEGSDFFPVEGRCTDNGGIPCGPYVSGYELSCAVCSK